MNSLRKSDLLLALLCMLYITGFCLIIKDYQQRAEANTPSHQQNPLVKETKQAKVTASPIRTGLTQVCHTSKSLGGVIQYQVFGDQGVVADYRAAETIDMSKKDYASLAGVTCFRGNNLRDWAAYGVVDIHKAELEQIWSVPIGGLGEWTGVGWNGQPAIVKWDDQWKKKMNIFQWKKEKKDLKEVIYATLDGNVYFLDLDDGKNTRPTIKIGGPVKGSLTVDPRGLPLLYVGQGIDKFNGRRVEMGYRIFSLLNQEKLYFLNGYDRFAYRSWGAFDSTALVDGKTDTMLLCGENGLFYRIKLNSNYNTTQNKISVQPQVTRYRYQVPGKGNHQGIENSVVVYKNLAYFADNGGVLQCLSINSLQPVWVRDVTDDTDSTCVVEEEDEKNVFLYTACEVDKQGVRGSSFIRKYDALTGEPQWEKDIKCALNTHTNGGALATPVLGKKEIANLIIYNIARCGTPGGGCLIALDKYTGQEVWKLNLTNYCWSSPVDVYANNGEAFLVACDSVGKMYLIQGKTGQVLHAINLGANVEGSPAIYENTIVVGTRGQRIIGVRIK